MKKLEKNKDKIKEESIMNSNSMQLFTMLSIYFLTVLVLFSLFQFVKLINLWLIQIISLIIPIVFYLLKNKKKSNKNKIIIIGIYLLLLLITPFIYNKTYDLTYDGNSYHKSAIAFIKNGWNPLYETTKSFQKKNSNVIKIANDTDTDIWVEHYPKATWIISAVIYNMTNNIESGKCITLILCIMLMIIGYNCLRKIMDKKWAIIISALLAFTPVVLPQIFTYYVDGIMGICFVIELFLLMIINPKEKIDKMTCINLISICALFVNLKFTGLVCSGVIAAIYYFYWLIANRKEKNFKYIFKRVTILFVIVFSIAIFVVGSNSYVKNTIDHHMPLYPLMGEGKVDIMTKNEPKAFQGKSNLEKFTISLFSKTENVTYSMEPTKKLPIRVYRAELDAMFIPDIRIGGFGPLFALIFIITILLFIPLMVLFYKNEKQNIKYILLPLASILITIIMVGESWWARYVPQLYFIPVGTLLLAIYGRKYFCKKIMKLIPYIILIPIVLNISCFIYTEYMQLKSFREITADINTLKIKGDAELKPTVNDLYGYLYTLNDNKVKYILVDELDEEERFFMYSWRLEVKRYD